MHQACTQLADHLEPPLDAPLGRPSALMGPGRALVERYCPAACVAVARIIVSSG